MQRTNLGFARFTWGDLARLAAVATLMTSCFATGSMAQQAGQKTFSSAEEASQAIFTAAKDNDIKAMLEILGPEGKQLVSSGDDSEDSQNRANFAERYQEMHRLLKEPDGTTTLYIGAENWPTPIPLVNTGKAWYFDTESGKKEILFRRIGRNELSAINVCEQLTAAEKEYHSTQHDEYAQRIFSKQGHDGLYWKTSEGEPSSPIGPLVASAVAEGYAEGQGGPPIPYRGYYFHVLKRQGKSAPGGAKSYIVNGKMTEGFAVMAYPAEYRSSGVMTFIIGEDGVVYQKDLGKNTATVAKAMKEYDPNSTWQKAEDQAEQASSDEKTQ